MDTLVLDGKSYVKASKAARDLGYATDYVGQLCRSGKVTAHLIGRTWYVNPDELTTHRVEKKRMSRIKAREQAHKSIAEHRMKSATPRSVRGIDISYESDTESLIPETRTVRIQSEQRTKDIDTETIDTKPTYINKGEKVKMSGSLHVVDLSDGIDSETTVLSPTAIKKSKSYTDTPRSQIGEVAIDSDSILNSKTETSTKDIDFSKKLASRNVTIEEDPEIEIQEAATIPSVLSAQESQSVIPYMLISLLLVSVSVISVFLSIDFTYSNTGAPYSKSSYIISINDTIEIIKLKI